jgi:hypothetical protein
MDIQDVKNYIIKNNLDQKDNRRIKTDQRMYLYAYLYHYLGIKNLSLIGKMFNKGHALVRRSLILAPDYQFQDSYIENNKELNAQIPFIAPKYIGQLTKKNAMADVSKKGKVYEVTLRVNKAVYFEFLKKQDPDIVLQFMFDNMIKMSKKSNKTRNPYKKSISL